MSSNVTSFKPGLATMPALSGVADRAVYIHGDDAVSPDDSSSVKDRDRLMTLTPLRYSFLSVPSPLHPVPSRRLAVAAQKNYDNFFNDGRPSRWTSLAAARRNGSTGEERAKSVNYQPCFSSSSSRASACYSLVRVYSRRLYGVLLHSIGPTVVH